jgi:hypothetical protein
MSSNSMTTKSGHGTHTPQQQQQQQQHVRTWYVLILVGYQRNVPTVHEWKRFN